MKTRPIEEARLRLASALAQARLAESRAVRDGLPDREWPLAWDRVVNARDLYRGASLAAIQSAAEDVLHAIDVLNGKVRGRCARCRRPWPDMFVLACPTCGGERAPAAWTAASKAVGWERGTA